MVPDYYAKNIFEIPVSFLSSIGIKYLFCDLDNTLDAFDVLVPSERVIELKKRLQQAEIEMFIISNNSSKRVKDYADYLGVKFLSSTHKPFKKRLCRFMKEQNVDKSQAMLIGDQLLTDVMCAKNSKIRVCLTDRIVKREQFTTHFNRLIDRPIRAMIRKKLKKREVPYGR